MPSYQIVFNHGNGSKSFEYFDASIKGTEIELAVKRADECRINRKSGACFWAIYRKPPRTLTVREYDMKKKQPLRGGHKFKLHLTFLELVTDSGRKERFESYEYND